MKKQLLLAMAFVATVFTVNAQEWNFSNMTVAEYSTTTTVNGLTMITDGAKALKINGSKKSFEDFSFTQRFQLPGAVKWDEAGENPINNTLSFPVAGNTTVTVIGVYGGSATGDPRPLICATGKDSEVGRFDYTFEGGLAKATFNYTGGATTLYLYSGYSGLNLYYIKAESTSVGISSTEAGKEVVATEYYNVIGMKLNEPAKGLNIVKNIMSDGSTDISKAYME